MTILEQSVEQRELPDYIDPEVLSRLGSGIVSMTDAEVTIGFVPSDRVVDLYQKGASVFWGAITEQLGDKYALKVSFVDDGVGLFAVPYQK